MNRLRFTLFFFVAVALFSANNRSHAGIPAAGLAGPGESAAPLSEGPPLDPKRWRKVEGDVLPLDHIWGFRASPTRGVFHTSEGIGLLYNSKPPEGYTGGARNQTGSLAFSQNVRDWQDYAGNPVLYEVFEWTGSDRAYPQAMLYDEINAQWVVYLGLSRGQFPGLRAVTTAFSTDMLNWTYSDGPTFTIDDYAAAVPELIEATPEELETEGRVYATWAIFQEGKYYVVISGTYRTGEDLPGQPDSGDRAYSSVMMVGDHPSGPFIKYEGFLGTLWPETTPIRCVDGWYAAVRGTWSGKTGFGIAHSDDWNGPYQMAPQNPVVEVDDATRSSPLLFRYGGMWAIIYSYQHTTDNMPMRMAYACHEPVDIKLDLSGDCMIGLDDLMIMLISWMECNLEPASACWK